MMKKISLNFGVYILFMLLGFSTAIDNLAHGQDHTVSSIVVLALNNGPLLEASVPEVGTLNGTAADVDGTFSFNVSSSDASLSVTFTGYSATIEDRDYITISLDEDTALPEGVVVTVGGIERKERALGYSVTEIDGEDLREVPKKQVFGLSSVSMTSEPSCPIHVRIVLKSSS